MPFVQLSTGKEYPTVMEAVKAFICPGPCEGCPIRALVTGREEPDISPIGPETCFRWAYDHEQIAMEHMGFVKKASPKEDMTLQEVQTLCTVRHAEFKDDACRGCVLNDPVAGDCTLKTYISGIPANWKLYDGLQFKDYDERKRLNGLYDAYGLGCTIRRYGTSNLVIALGEGDTLPLPSVWFAALPDMSFFSLDEAHGNKFHFVSVQYMAVTDPDSAPHYPSFGATIPCGQPSQPMQPGQDGQEGQ